MSETAPNEYGWRVHSALDAWTGKVDTKASIALAIESAVLGYVLNQTASGQGLADLDGLRQAGFYLGLGLLLAAVGCAVWVVFPRLRRRASSREEEWARNTIYFGHLRHWDPEKLEAKLAEGAPVTGQLARQLVKMAEIAWSKHVWLQASLVFLSLGVVCILTVSAT